MVIGIVGDESAANIAQGFEGSAAQRRRQATNCQPRQAATLCGERVVIQNSGAGMHLVAWLPGFDQPGLQRLIAAAQQRGVGHAGLRGGGAAVHVGHRGGVQAAVRRTMAPQRQMHGHA